MKYHNHLKTLAIGLLLLCRLTNSEAQRAENYVVGDILIQTQPNANIQDIIRDLEVVEGIPTGIFLKKEISSPMRIWLLAFDAEKIPQQRMIDAAHFHPKVSIAQVNHLLEERAVPNDQQYPQQWQYNNTGQSNGTIGADIDADSAWDIATGGLTALGDTIVVCIIDGGIDLNHNDLTPNRWFNHGEIPNDNLDNDGNGYVDDYLGWNTAQSNDNISGSSHGTSVAGIIGAKGNNGIGVAGINWDVKLMIIRGGTGIESEVLQAYTYPLVQRQRYNNSNGAEGAFVVATNASWGVNGGQPANAPLWCAMYDTLGKYGILNAGAGPNLNVDVDVFGDLPTACPSEYLVAVTNMNHFDKKVNQAPVGPISIDLGAFGDGTWTTTNNGYAAFGGTSGATPHVAGAIGLLYSANCPGFAAVAKANPALAASMARDYILNNVDANADLAGLTTTGGRLNLYKTMLDAVNTCPPANCLPPFGITLSNLLDTSATLNWQVISDTTETFNFYYKNVTDTAWIISTDTLTSINLTNLSPCTTYEIKIELVCDSSSSFSNAFLFETEGCCLAPNGLAATTLSDTSAALNWNPVFAANQYIVQYKQQGSQIWVSDTTNNNTLTINDLAFCLTYEYRVQTVCDTGTTLPSPIFTFYSGCGTCTQNYCTSKGVTEYEWIASVSIDTFTKVSNNNDGYYQHNGVAVILNKGTYPVSVTPAFANNSFPEKSQIWIDYNQDGDFADAGELAVDFAVNSGAATGNLIIPITATAGITRLRVSMKYQNAATVCETGFDGETEDYCIEITNIIQCQSPSNLDTTSTALTTIDLNWTANPSATAYILRYKIANATTWTHASSTINSAILSGLSPCNQYDIQVASVCAIGDTSNFTPSFLVNTRCATGVFQPLENIQNLSVFPNPFAQQITLTFELATPQNVAIQLLNANGQIIQNQDFGQLSGAQNLKIAVTENLAKGIYILKIQTENGVTVRRMIH